MFKKTLTLCSTIFFLSVNSITSMAAGTVVEKTQTDAAAEESSVPSFEESTHINYAYYSDEEWIKFRDKYIAEYESGNKTALDIIRGLIDSGGCSAEQIESLFELGYFTEDIERYKYLRYIPEDYKLPEGITIHETPYYNVEGTITLIDEEDPNVTYVHEVTETLSIDAQKTMVALMNDNVRNNAYVTCPVSSKEKHIAGHMLYASSITQDPLVVMFLNDDGSHAMYSWELGYCLYYNEQDLNLEVTYEDGRLDFDLGDTLPSAVTLHVYTGITEDNVRLNLKNADGTIAYTLPVVEGFITLDDVTKDGHYNISRAVVEEPVKDTDPSVVETKEKRDLTTISPISNYIFLGVVLLLIATGSVLITYAIGTKNKK